MVQQPLPATRPLNHIMVDIERGLIKIPQFQRDFVWSREKSAKLIDSILRGFPIGTFILWKTREEFRSIRDLGGLSIPATPSGDFIQYVLDGQQRLTSLYATMKGLAIARSENKKEDFSAMYIDLDVDPKSDSTTDIVICSDSEKPGKSYTSIKDLLSKDFDELKVLARYRERVREYKATIGSYNCSVIEVPDASVDIAAEIFTRINTTGKDLTTFEIMVAKTFDSKLNFDLEQKTDDLYEDLRRVDYDTISPMVVLRAIAVIMGKDSSQKSLLNLEKRAFIDAWPKAEDAILRAVEHLRRQIGVPVSGLLPYDALIVPFAYYFSEHPDPPDRESNRRLTDFFWRVALGEYYSVALDSKIAQDRNRIRAILDGKLPSYNYTVKISKDLVRQNGDFYTTRSFVKAILCLLAAQNPKSFRDGAQVSVRNDWLIRANSKNYHHFFPKSLFVDPTEANHIANITIVDDYLNKRIIRNRWPADYMQDFNRDNGNLKSTMRTHFINVDKDGIWDNDFASFLDRRCATIANALSKKLIDQNNA